MKILEGGYSVHPRVCGERDAQDLLSDAQAGSSPRVRGTVRADDPEGDLCRFIPACAGNGARKRAGKRTSPVHPRVCGERAVRHHPGRVCAGSSPRVRGTGVVDHDQFARERFIPACAGNGHRSHDGASREPVHPRVCGERSRHCVKLARSAGSSPRVRGTVRRAQFRHPGNRFIPACAGNGPSPPSRRAEPSVHPRVCGERCTATGEKCYNTGSSPRVRGTGGRRRRNRKRSRFIPACAGNGCRHSSQQ